MTVTLAKEAMYKLDLKGSKIGVSRKEHAKN